MNELFETGWMMFLLLLFCESSLTRFRFGSGESISERSDFEVVSIESFRCWLAKTSKGARL